MCVSGEGRRWMWRIAVLVIVLLAPRSAALTLENFTLVNQELIVAWAEQATAPSVVTSVPAQPSTTLTTNDTTVTVRHVMVDQLSLLQIRIRSLYDGNATTGGPLLLLHSVSSSANKNNVQGLPVVDILLENVTFLSGSVLSLAGFSLAAHDAFISSLPALGISPSTIFSVNVTVTDCAFLMGGYLSTLDGGFPAAGTQVELVNVVFNTTTPGAVPPRDSTYTAPRGLNAFYFSLLLGDFLLSNQSVFRLRYVTVVTNTSVGGANFIGAIGFIAASLRLATLSGIEVSHCDFSSADATASMIMGLVFYQMNVRILDGSWIVMSNTSSLSLGGGAAMNVAFLSSPTELRDYSWFAQRRNWLSAVSAGTASNYYFTMDQLVVVGQSAFELESIVASSTTLDNTGTQSALNMYLAGGSSSNPFLVANRSKFEHRDWNVNATCLAHCRVSQNVRMSVEALVSNASSVVFMSASNATAVSVLAVTANLVVSEGSVTVEGVSTFSVGTLGATFVAMHTATTAAADTAQYPVNFLVESSLVKLDNGATFALSHMNLSSVSVVSTYNIVISKSSLVGMRSSSLIFTDLSLDARGSASSVNCPLNVLLATASIGVSDSGSLFRLARTGALVLGGSPTSCISGNFGLLTSNVSATLGAQWLVEDVRASAGTIAESTQIANVAITGSSFIVVRGTNSRLTLRRCSIAGVSQSFVRNVQFTGSAAEVLDGGAVLLEDFVTMTCASSNQISLNIWMTGGSSLFVASNSSITVHNISLLAQSMTNGMQSYNIRCDTSSNVAVQDRSTISIYNAVLNASWGVPFAEFVGPAPFSSGIAVNVLLHESGIAFDRSYLLVTNTTAVASCLAGTCLSRNLQFHGSSSSASLIQSNVSVSNSVFVCALLTTGAATQGDASAHNWYTNNVASLVVDGANVSIQNITFFVAIDAAVALESWRGGAGTANVKFGDYTSMQTLGASSSLWTDCRFFVLFFFVIPSTTPASTISEEAPVSTALLLSDRATWNISGRSRFTVSRCQSITFAAPTEVTSIVALLPIDFSPSTSSLILSSNSSTAAVTALMSLEGLSHVIVDQGSTVHFAEWRCPANARAILNVRGNLSYVLVADGQSLLAFTGFRTSGSQLAPGLLPSSSWALRWSYVVLMTNRSQMFVAAKASLRIGTGGAAAKNAAALIGIGPLATWNVGRDSSVEIVDVAVVVTADSSTHLNSTGPSLAALVRVDGLMMLQDARAMLLVRNVNISIDISGNVGGSGAFPLPLLAAQGPLRWSQCPTCRIIVGCAVTYNDVLVSPQLLPRLFANVSLANVTDAQMSLALQNCLSKTHSESGLHTSTVSYGTAAESASVSRSAATVHRTETYRTHEPTPTSVLNGTATALHILTSSNVPTATQTETAFDDAPLLIPRRLAAKAVTASSGVAAVIAALATSPSVGIAVRRTSLLAHLDACDNLPDASDILLAPVDMTSAPLQLRIPSSGGAATGSDGWQLGAEQRGAVVGNLVFCWLVLPALVVVAAGLRVIVFSKRQHTGTMNGSGSGSSASVPSPTHLDALKESLTVLHLPGLVLALCAVLQQQITLSSVLLLQQAPFLLTAQEVSEVSTVVIGVAGLVGGNAAFLVVLSVLLDPRRGQFAALERKVHEVSRRERRCSQGAVISVVQQGWHWWTFRCSRWDSWKPPTKTTEGKDLATLPLSIRCLPSWMTTQGKRAVFAECFCVLFDAARGGCHWWMLVDTVTTLAIGVAAGLVPATAAACRIQQWVCVGMCGVALLVSLVCRPLASRCGNAVLLFNYGCQFVIALLSAVDVGDGVQAGLVWSATVVTLVQSLTDPGGLLLAGILALWRSPSLVSHRDTHPAVAALESGSVRGVTQEEILKKLIHAICASRVLISGAEDAKVESSGASNRMRRACGTRVRFWSPAAGSHNANLAARTLSAANHQRHN